MHPFAPAAVAALVAVLVGVTGCAGQDGQERSAAGAAQPPGSSAIQPGGGFADLVARVEPSVVTVRVAGGLGSGVVYQPDVVLTNQHVVGDASTVTVEFADGSTSPGKVVGTDVVTDLAVVRTERTDLPVPEYRTELPRTGEVVLALGSPLGFEGSVTAGVVSGVNRVIPGSAEQTRALVDLIQTDAAMSPGNSGGALLDPAGRVIGINEAYLPPSTGAVAIGFAIPAATAVDVAEQLLADGAVTHPFLGVSLGRLTPEIAQALNLQVEDGVLVRGVEPGGPAASAGMRQGDVIVEFADRPVTSIEEALGILRGTEPGQQVGLTVVRDGQRQDLTVTIGAQTG